MPIRKTTALLFLLCFHTAFAQPRMDPDALILIIMKNEATKLLKQTCDEKFPQYREPIEVAYRASPFAAIESERAIEIYAEPARHSSFQRVLASVRSSTRQDFESMDATTLEKRCSDYGRVVAELSKPLR